jgi:hypothetical protein
MSHFIYTLTGERNIRAPIVLLLAGFFVGAPAMGARAGTGDSSPSLARTAVILTEHGSTPTLGATVEWAWAQRLERELCARYGDASCSG